MRKHKFVTFWAGTSSVYFVSLPFALKEETPPLGDHLVQSLTAPAIGLLAGSIVAWDSVVFTLHAFAHGLNVIENGLTHRKEKVEPFEYNGIVVKYSVAKGFGRTDVANEKNWKITYGKNDK